jgi:hypothetical protein
MAARAPSYQVASRFCEDRHLSSDLAFKGYDLTTSHFQSGWDVINRSGLSVAEQKVALESIQTDLRSGLYQVLGKENSDALIAKLRTKGVWIDQLNVFLE